MADENGGFIDPMEDCPWRSPRQIFARSGYTPFPPGELDNGQLTGRLWELLYAAAARRIFFYQTDHLGDREFYSLLYEQWLDEPTADIPLEAETNTSLLISEFNAGGLTGEEIWLRHYAEEADKDLWQSAEPDFIFVPHQDPPFDRDRFLPVPPIPLEAHGGWLPGDDIEPEDDEPDPLGLAKFDREIAASATELTPGPAELDPPDSVLEAQLRASEPENWVSPAEKFKEENIPLLPPDEITDETLAPILWELLHNLALCGFYVLHTDHLSDRELYVAFWQRGLRDPACLTGRNSRGGWFHDFLGRWGAQEMQLWLRYYASEAERGKHAVDWPNDTIPPKEPLRLNRDWRLPKGPF